MKIHKIGQLIASFILALSSLLAVSLPMAHATPTTWYWCGGTTGNFSVTTWNTNSSCSGGTTGTPANGDSLVFDNTSLSGDATITQDISGLQVADITFSGSSNYSFTIQGSNGITIGGTVTNTTTNFIPVYLSLDITLNANTTIAGSGVIDLGGGSYTTQNLNVGSYTLTNTNTDPLNIQEGMEGTGPINITSGGIVVNYGSSYTGTSYSGTITVSANNSLSSVYGMSGNASIVMGANTYLAFNSTPGATSTISTSITLNGDGISNNGKIVEPALHYIFNNTSGDQTVKLTNVVLGADSTYQGEGDIADTAQITTTGGYKMSAVDGSEGQLQVNGQSISSNVLVTDITDSEASSYNYGTTASPLSVPDNSNYTIQAALSPGVFEVKDGGILELDDNSNTGAVTVDSGGMLKGTGTTGASTVDSGGILSPGHSPGCLTVNGNLNEGGTLQEEIEGTSACSSYDQLIVSSGNTVTLDDGKSPPTQGKLDVSFLNNFIPKAGDSFEIINNQGSQPVSDTFQGLPEGSELTVNNVVFKISYKGGDGNDVVLTVVKVPGTPNTGSALVSADVTLPLLGSGAVAGGLYLSSKRNLKIKLKNK